MNQAQENGLKQYIYDDISNFIRIAEMYGYKSQF